MSDRLERLKTREERLKAYEPIRKAGRQKRKNILYQKFQTQGKTDLLQNQKPIKKIALDPNRVHSPNVLPRTTFEFKTEGKQSLLTSKPIKDRGVKVSPATVKSVIRITEKKHLGHPKLQGSGQTLRTETTLKNLSERARFADWYRSPMRERNIKKHDAIINRGNVAHLKTIDEIRKGGVYHDMKGSKSISFPLRTLSPLISSPSPDLKSLTAKQASIVRQEKAAGRLGTKMKNLMYNLNKYGKRGSK